MFITNIKNIFPFRIVSLVPSISSLLHHLQLENETVGITKFCIHPSSWVKTKTIVGGTKNIDIKKIISLKPDLIICSKEENILEQINELANSNNVFVTDVKNFEDALQMITNIGIITDKQELSVKLAKDIKNKFEKDITATKKAIYLIWQDPYMTVGGDTFINSMMQKAGFENLFINTLRYPITSIEEMKALNPSYILLSSEPYPFKQKHLNTLQLHFPKSKLLLIDGEIFSWYGNTMLKAPDYFTQLTEQI